MTIAVVNGPTINAGQSASGGIDAGSKEIICVIMPSDWTPAILTFSISYDGVTYYALRFDDGTAVDVSVVPNSAVLVPAVMARAVAWIKFHSGTLEAPVPQVAQRDFKIVTSTP